MMERLDELTLAYYEETASPEDIAELDRVLSEDDEALSRFVLLSRVHAGLTKLAKGENVLLGPLDGERARPAVRPVYWGALAASVTLLVGAAAYVLPLRSRTADTSGPRLAAVPPGAVVTRGEAAMEPNEDTALRPGDILESGEVGDVVIGYPDGETRVTLAPDSRLRLGDPVPGRKIFLARGGLRAEVASRPAGKRMTVATPHAQVTIAGTVFRMRVTRDWTGVEVEKGAVRARTRKKQEPVEITEGYSGITKKDGEIAVAEMPRRVPPVPEDERTRLLAAETPAQKALRAELREMAAQGQHITFCTNIDGIQRIYTMRPDGSGIRCLTPSPGPGGFNPHVSPDGAKVIFEDRIDPGTARHLPADPRYRKGGNEGVGLMDIHGDNRRLLTVGGAPHWSPDGRRVVYHYPRLEGGWRLGIFDIGTGVETALDGIPPQGRDPVFSPDGKLVIAAAKLAFFVVSLGTGDEGSVEVTNVASFNHLKGIDAALSPDGRHLVWVENKHKSAGSWLFHASFGPDGTIAEKESLPLGWSAGPSANYHPHFSPCGRYLVYAHAKSLPDVKSWMHTSKHELYVTRFPSCDATVRITWNNAGNKHPHWWKPAETRQAMEMERE